MLAIIPFAEIAAAFIASLGAFLGLKVVERGFLKSFLQNWIEAKTVTFDGGKIEFLDKNKSSGNVSDQLTAYINYEELVRETLQKATNQQISTVYDKDNCDFYIDIDARKIGIEAKNNFNNVPLDHIKALLSNDIMKLILVSEQPFSKKFLNRIYDADAFENLYLISAKDSDLLESEIKKAVENTQSRAR